MAKVNPPAPPTKHFDWNLLESLAILEANCNYVAERMLLSAKIPPDEITRTMIQSMHKRINRRLCARFDVSYVQYVDQKKEEWRIRLRSLQRKAAIGGNVTMQIWLGKQDLGQSDKFDHKAPPSQDSKLIIEFSKDDEGKEGD